MGEEVSSMNKTINQLEKERKDKIKDLNLDEVKAYITNLNKKVYESFNNPENVELYENKLKEVFELTSDKYVNLGAYSLLKKFEMSTSKMIENNTKKEIAHITHTSISLTHSYINLQELYSILNYVLMIYYHNYYTKENMLVDDLLAHLHTFYDFDNESFDEYARSRVTPYNEILMKELNSLIDMMKTYANLIIELSDKDIKDDFEDIVSSVLKEIEYEKAFVNKKGKSDEGVKVLREGEYLDLLEALEDSYVLYGESCRNYIEIRDEILKLINSPDGFSHLKERNYEFENENMGLSISKEEYIASRPSYDVSECEFIQSD